MSLIDKIIFFFGIYLFWRGWSKGLFKTILGPAALFVGSLISYFYYILTANVLIALLIAILCPILINILFSILMNALLNPDKNQNPNLLSRFAGGVIRVIWGEFFLLAGIIFILILPFELPGLTTFQTHIKNSSVYSLIKPYLHTITNNPAMVQYDPKKLMNALSDPKTIKSIEQSDEYLNVINDPNVQNLLKDSSLFKDAENKKFGQLIQNPKFIALTKDPAFLKKFIALYTLMIKEAQKSIPHQPPTPLP